MATPIAPPTPNVQETRPGVRTTEFWLVIAGLLLGVIQEAIGVFHVTDATVLRWQGVLIAAYAVARGLAKAGVPCVQTQSTVINEARQ